MGRLPHIEYDYRFMLHEHIHESGVTKRAFADMVKELGEAQEQIRRSNVVKGLLSGAAKQELKYCKELAKNLKTKARTLIVIGIGGSDLGARTILQTLEGKNVVFVGGTTDPDALEVQLADVDLASCAVNVVSKSGETVETLAAFAVVEDRLARTVGEKKLKERVVVTTGMSGTLLVDAERQGYAVLHIPEHVGGRFSVLTACGLFPAAFAGIAIEKLVAGAEAVFNEAVRTLPERSGPLLFAGLHARAYADERIMNTVLMPYASSLEMFAFWFRQLWAESLGKRENRRGGTVQHGLMPIVSMGPTDQHSQLQLYLDGPNTNAVTFVSWAKRTQDITIPRLRGDGALAELLKGKKMGEVLDAERKATARALAEAGRMNGTLMVGKRDAEHLGALLAFFMSATITMGELLDINPFDQPAVENIKRHVIAFLKK